MTDDRGYIELTADQFVDIRSQCRILFSYDHARKPPVSSCYGRVGPSFYHVPTSPGQHGIFFQVWSGKSGWYRVTYLH